MVTLIICLVVIFIAAFITHVASKDGEETISLLSGILAIMLVFFAIFFPIIYGLHMAENHPAITEYLPLENIGGQFYYLKDDKWTDILSVYNSVQGDALFVEKRTAPSSVWYWQMSYIQASIPIGTRIWLPPYFEVEGE